MMCGYMIERNGRFVPCGQCMPCRINKKREWVGKMLLEHAHSPVQGTFATLTYNPQHHPENGSLDVTELQRYIKRLRKRVGSFRYFGVGEYGSKTWRPHYHVVLFGLPAHVFEKPIRDAWSVDGEEIGFVQVGEVTRASISYVAGYTTKKMTANDHPELHGRKPEFSVMSKKPAIGYGGINHLIELLMTKTGSAALAEMEDVPNTFRIEGKVYPISQYWRQYMRYHLGITNPNVNSSWQIDYESLTKEFEKANKVAVRLWETERRNHKARTL